MGKNQSIILSESTKNYFNDCKESLSDSLEFPEGKVDLKTLVSYLTSPKPVIEYTQSEKEKNYVVTLLHTSLLVDISNSLKQDEEDKNIKEENNKITFIMLLVAGTLLAACEGFDGIAAILAVLHTPLPILFAVGILFSIISVVVFYGFSLSQVSKNLGIKLTDVPKLLDLYISQLETLKGIRKKVKALIQDAQDEEELQQFLSILNLIEVKLKELAKIGAEYDKALHGLGMLLIKGVVTGVSSILFFGGGYFTGQSVALYFLGIIVTAPSPTFWPVILFSVFIGLAALSLYVYVERIGVNKLISSWFGLDEKKIGILKGPAIGAEIEKIKPLKNKIEDKNLFFLPKKLIPDNMVHEPDAFQPSLFA